MVKSIPKENFHQFCSMVNVDSFGLSTPQSPANMSSPKMIKMAKDLAKELKLGFADASINNADADSSSFLSKKIPAITFHGLSGDWQKFLHGENDKTENVNAGSVYLGYRFILSYLAKIDALSCSEFK
jgi:Iap family predicted aminopeptidase